MLNSKNQRELAYVVSIGWVKPIEGADNIELIGINGWTCIAKKGEFKKGDLAVYFEIDSKLPETAEWAAFLAPKHYKVKTMKLSKFGVISQGLALPAEAFGWKFESSGQFAGDVPLISTGDSIKPYFVEGDFLTEYLGVKYSVDEDNKRKANVNPDAKINSALARHPQIAKKWGKLIKKNKVVRWIFLALFGRKKDSSWPAWVVKTDEERVQNMPWILNDKEEWFATEKIDGTSTTFTIRKNGLKKDFYICSRNVCFDTPEKMANGAYYDTNVYQEMAIKYGLKFVLTHLLDSDPNLKFVTIQGETYGDGIQKRTYSIKHHNLAVFNLIFGYKDGTTRRCNPREMTDILVNYGLDCVPIVDEHFVLPDTIEELLAIATDKSILDGGMREGLVFRSADGTKSFKAVSNEFLLKYHQ